MRGDAFFFLGIFVFIFVIWVATGGPSRPISFAGPFLTPLTSTGETHGYYITGADDGSNASNEDIGNQLSQAQTQATQLQTQVTELQNFGTPSPYKNDISVSQGPTQSGAGRPNQEYLTLQVGGDSPSLNLSGWKIESTVTGNVETIPFGTTVPMSGLINPIQPIQVQPGDVIYIVSGTSPIGASFRTNLCTGYFAQYQSFTPNITQVCPDPVDAGEESLSNLDNDDACRSYLNTLQTCQIPGNTPPGLSNDCQNFIQNDLNYNGCVMQNQNKPGFTGIHWYVYLGRTTNMWKSEYETVKILDANGDTVLTYTY